MNKHEFDIGYTQLETYYMTKANPSRYDHWWEKMKHLSATAFMRACDLWIEEGRHFPTLGQIKRMAYDNRTAEEIKASQPGQREISPEEEALGRDLIPLFLDYLNKKTTREEWIEQMQYFANKHGLDLEAARVASDQKSKEMSDGI